MSKTDQSRDDADHARADRGNASDTSDRAPSLIETTASVSAGFFGVQSSKNRKRDFSRGKPIHFIVIGLVLTLLLVAALWGGVHLLLTLSGSPG